MRQLPGMMNPNFGADKSYSFKKGFPTRENCDLEDPKEMFLWMQVALPGVRGAALVMPIEYNMMVSEHYHECGAQLACRACGHMAEPVKKYQHPASGEPHWMTAPGRWVPLGTPDVDKHPARKALDKLTAPQKAELRQMLNDEAAQGHDSA